MATRHACHHLKHRSHNMDRFYFLISNIHKYILCYYEISDIPIVKYVQVNVFVQCLNTFIMTVLVDRLTGAAMLVRAESDLCCLKPCLKHVNSCSPPETR